MTLRPVPAYEPLPSDEDAVASTVSAYPPNPLLRHRSAAQRDRSPFCDPGASTNAYGVLAVSIMLAVLISVANLSLISVVDALNAYTYTNSPKRAPSVYAGLESLSSTGCRRRVTFPARYATTIDGRVGTEHVVHAHRDEVLFAFGGSTSALVTFRVPDYGLENCTLSFAAFFPPTPQGSVDVLAPVNAENIHENPAPSSVKKGFTRADYMHSTTIAVVPPGAALDVHLVDATPNAREPAVFLGALDLKPLSGTNGSVTTPPFFCRSQSQVVLSVTCAGHCQWLFGLQGMTLDTSSAASQEKTGFRMTQWERLDCI